ncbi:MAG: hypothetical protein LUD83_03055 [Clostridiales bacterium]|nr:hypothetical protein [Clostridiales bacterium]
MKRKTRNRIISLLLAAALLLTLCGCGRVARSDDGSELSAGSSAAAPEESASSLPPEESAGLEPGEASSDLEPEVTSSEVTPEETPEESADPEPEAASSEAKPEESAAVPENTGGTQTIDEQIDALLAGMTLEEKIWQLFVVTPEQLLGAEDAVTSWSSALTRALAEKPVGGLILFKQNIVSPSQTKSLLSDAQASAAYGLPLSVDEKGGTVARVSGNPNMGYAAIPDMGDIGATGDTDEAYQVGLTLGRELTELGFNLDFAPVADVDSNPNNPVIGDRSFGSDPALVANMVAAAVEGFHQGGVLCTLKHFPGHGDTDTDSHEGFALTNKTLDELWDCELIPFQAGIEAGADCVMVAHISAPNVTGGNTPASLSSTLVDGLLRDELGFDGLVITDAMDMGAITTAYTQSEAAVLAIKAGVDLLLKPEDMDEMYQALLDAVKSGELSESRIEESVRRVLRVKLENGAL